MEQVQLSGGAAFMPRTEGAALPNSINLGGAMNAKLNAAGLLRHLKSGEDRFGQSGLMIWGLLPLAIKVSGKDTGGQILLFEHREMGKGGPPRHIHFEQDEWFYVLQGKFVFEVGGKQSVLGPNETLFAPRNIPHGWACVSEEPGTLLTLVTPVGSFEEFILGTTLLKQVPSQDEMARTFLAHRMEVVGPPLVS